MYKRLKLLLEGLSTGSNPYKTAARVSSFLRKNSTHNNHMRAKKIGEKGEKLHNKKLNTIYKGLPTYKIDKLLKLPKYHSLSIGYNNIYNNKLNTREVYKAQPKNNLSFRELNPVTSKKIIKQFQAMDQKNANKGPKFK